MARPACRILVVDDDASVREALRDLLEAEGYPVRTADDGASALLLVAADPPQVIALDIGMPGVSGWDLAEALKGAGVAIPILVLTAVQDPGAVAREIGKADWIAKPFDLVDLLGKVERLSPGG